MIEHEDGSVTLTREDALEIGGWCLNAQARIAMMTTFIDYAAEEVKKHVAIAIALDKLVGVMVEHKDLEDVDEVLKDVKSILEEHGW